MVLVQKANKLSILKIEQYRPLLSIGMICFQMINKACFSALPLPPAAFYNYRLRLLIVPYDCGAQKHMVKDNSTIFFFPPKPSTPPPAF